MASSHHTSTNTETISELLFTGRKFHANPEHTKYVCHTSTIPLATTVNNQPLLEDWSDTVEVTHSIMFQPGFDINVDYRCCKKHCMFVGRFTHHKELLRGNCPCNKIVREERLPDGEEVDTYLQPLCFLQVLKELRYRFGYLDASACESDSECCHNDGSRAAGIDSNRPRIDLDEVMFCQDGTAVTDESYPRPLREAVGFSGWTHADTPKRLSSILDQLYWYREFVRDNTRTYLANKCSELGPHPFRRVLEQCLHTLNGAVIKKLLLFPCEMEGYRKLAQLTAGLFSELVRDYFRTPDPSITSDGTSLFMLMKKDMNEVKQHFASDHIEHRLHVLSIFQGRKDGWARFWGPGFNRLRKRVEGLDADYTTSPAFIYTMSGFCQTRNLGHLPRWVAELKRRSFREAVGRPREEITPADMTLIMKLIIRQAKRAGIEPRFLEVTADPATLDFKEVITHLEIPLKPTASVKSTVSAGGKVEDARQLFEDACENSWVVPIRDFKTGLQVDEIRFSPELRKEAPGYQGHLFWLSLQLLVNAHYEHDNSKFALEYKPLPRSEAWIKAMFTMSIVHISEPGKERNLTKTSSPLAWVLTVASKISQCVLSYSQDHRAGLVLSSQDWMHQRRVSAESFESEWLYDLRTRKIRPVWNGFQDWTQSTDWIPRRVGASALRAWFAYIAFPDWFGRIVLWSTQRDYDVREVTGTDDSSGSMEPIVFRGVVREGWMMSMPLTKTVLHLMHDINVGLLESIMEKHGLPVSERATTSRADVERDKHGPFVLVPPLGE